jgi:hypothetical protein
MQQFNRVLVLAASLAAIGALAQTLPTQPAPTPQPATTTSQAPNANTSLDQLAARLRDLHQSVNQTLPALEAVTGTTTNNQPGRLGGLLGGIFNRETNQAPQNSSVGNTNSVVGNIVRGVLGTNAPTGSSSTFSDLEALREQLRTISPFLDRLNAGLMATNQLAAPNQNSPTTNLTPTGR